MNPLEVDKEFWTFKKIFTFKELKMFPFTLIINLSFSNNSGDILVKIFWTNRSLNLSFVCKKFNSSRYFIKFIV